MKRQMTRCLLMLSICCFVTSCINNNDTQEISKLKPVGMTGKAVYILEGGVEAELFSQEGKGIINHMWFGGNNRGWDDGLGDLQIRIYVDGEEIPSIDM